MSLIEIAEAFKKARIQSRLTQRQVADASGIGLITISKLERGALTEIGTVKLLALLRTVGLELVPGPANQRRTLNDVAQELDVGSAPEDVTRLPQRVRHRSRKP